jgi:hypothetical protein
MQQPGPTSGRLRIGGISVVVRQPLSADQVRAALAAKGIEVPDGDLIDVVDLLNASIRGVVALTRRSPDRSRIALPGSAESAEGTIR